MNPLPTVFNVTGGGGRCTTDGGLAVGLSGSETGVNYQLLLNGANAGAPVAGTGSALAFPAQTAAGTYTVQATNATTACGSAMSGSAVITAVVCGPTISDPCSCLNNATTLANGQFGETITVNAPAGQTWTVSSVTGLFSSASGAPPTPPTPIAVGTVLVASGTTYTLTGRHVDAIGYTVSVTNGRGTTLTVSNSCAYPNPVINGLDGAFCLNSPAVTLSGDPGDANIAGQSFTVNGTAATVFNPATLGVGTHTVVYTVNGGLPKASGASDPGCTQGVSKQVQIIATSSTVVCNDNVQLSLDEDCRSAVSPDDVLEGSYGCYDDYQVQIFNSLGQNMGNILTSANIGQTLRVNVRHIPSGNFCWGSVSVEDKLPPVPLCPDVWAVCAARDFSPGYLSGVLGIAAAAGSATDNCSLKSLTHIDGDLVDADCDFRVGGREVSAYFVRKWTAVDASGNTGTCEQNIYLERRHVWDVLFPADEEVSCSSAASARVPFVRFNGVDLPVYPASTLCEFNVAFADDTLRVCDGTNKVLRTWTVYDWCLPTGSGTAPVAWTNPRYHLQVVKFFDDRGPVAQCPSDLTVSTESQKCCVSADLPDFVVSDNCSRVKDVVAMVTVRDGLANNALLRMEQVGGQIGDFPANNWWVPDTMAYVGRTTCLPIGRHEVRYTVSDDCGNLTFCNFALTVADYVPPVLSCDQLTVVSIDGDDPYDCYLPKDSCVGAGVGYLKAATLDDGSYDNCRGGLEFQVRRMAPYSAFIESLDKSDGTPPCGENPGERPTEFERATLQWDSLKLYCGEVGTTQTVVVRAYQLEPNGDRSVNPAADAGPDGEGQYIYSECMVQVEVQDKVRPACLPPAHVTVSCENFDPSLWAYGNAKVSDNCCLDQSKHYLAQCGLTHTVSYNQFDTSCNKGTLIRTFRAYDCHDNSVQCTQRVVVTYEEDYYVRFPDDRIVTVCDGSGQYGAPVLFGEDCELLAVSFDDDTFTVVPDACYKIERRWKVINWCTYDPNCDLAHVPNPTPNATVNAPANLVGPIVSDIDGCNPATINNPWRSACVRINPTDAANTSYTRFWQLKTSCRPTGTKFNGYEYVQIIKIVDGVDPVAQCAKPDTCDVTDNDADFWNVDYWWDATHQSHDLCEMPIDLKITATDACSGANLNFRYLLFLDLDGNGTMETVVSSSNLPGVNTVFYNNAGNPNYTGGIARQFDHRAPPRIASQPLDWYRFAIQVTRTGANATGAVRFNTVRTPNTYVLPQLPHGKHKIKWIIEDGCGNETVCEYPFEIKDCKAPTVVCKPLSVNIMPTGMVTLWASDFLEYTFDNCTPSEQLEIAVSAGEPAPSAFPRDPVTGLPITNITFDCTQLGANVVQLWAEDKARNADYCQVVLLVQDNAGNCAQKATVAGELATFGSQGIEEGNVQLSGSHPAFPPVSLYDMSDGTGEYGFSNAVPIHGSFRVTPEKTDNPLNGVTTLDLALISKHILGIQPLVGPYNMIAADANKSGSVTTFDVVELRKLILGIYDELPNNKSWRFFDRSFVFADPSSPFASNAPEYREFSDMQNDRTSEHFVGVKIGDVNGTAVANNLMQVDDRTNGTTLFDVDDRSVKAGEVFEVKFKSAGRVPAYQFTMNHTGLEVVDIVPGAEMGLDNFGVFSKESVVTTSWNGDAAQAEFVVKFRAAQNGQLSKMLGVSSRITKSESYVDGERRDVAFRFNNGVGSVVSGVGFELYQNSPNPFVDKTVIGFHLPEATNAVLSVYDEAGKMVHRQAGAFAKGVNRFVLERSLVPTTGLLYYTVETEKDSATRKMIQTK